MADRKVTVENLKIALANAESLLAAVRSGLEGLREDQPVKLKELDEKVLMKTPRQPSGGCPPPKKGRKR